MPTAAEILHSYWEAECRLDVEAVMRHYRADAMLELPTGRWQGASIREYYKRSLAELRSLRITDHRVIGDGDLQCIEFSAVVIRSNWTEFDGASVADCDGELIKHLKVYFDPSPAR